MCVNRPIKANQYCNGDYYYCRNQSLLLSAGRVCQLPYYHIISYKSRRTTTVLIVVRAYAVRRIRDTVLLLV